MLCPSDNEPTYNALLLPRKLTFAVPGSFSLLQAAEAAGLAGHLPSSCRNGTCRTCICRLLEGRVTYDIEWPGLSADEKRDGFILPCVAFAASDVVLQLE